MELTIRDYIKRELKEKDQQAVLAYVTFQKKRIQKSEKIMEIIGKIIYIIGQSIKINVLLLLQLKIHQNQTLSPDRIHGRRLETQ